MFENLIVYYYLFISENFALENEITYLIKRKENNPLSTMTNKMNKPNCLINGDKAPVANEKSSSFVSPSVQLKVWNY